MTRGKVKNMLAMLPLLQAYAEGATLQVNLSDRRSSIPQWQDVPNPEFNGDPSDYRIKPDPVVRWAILRMDGKISMLYSSEQAAAEALEWCRDTALEYQDARVIKFVEETK